MNTYVVEVSRVIPASAEAIYAVISDYKVGHQAILPKPYFTNMTVERGGQGAGTVALVHMNVMGSKLTFRLETSEPEPGRVLEEVDQAAGLRTRFILEPQTDGSCRVTIRTENAIRPGFPGLMERLVNPPIMRRIYQKELALLADYVRR